MKKRPSRSDTELQEASKHLYYEWVMLLDLAIRLRTRKRPQAIQNAYLESFTVHARALSCFVYPEDTRFQQTDVLAEDYIGSVDWGGRRPSKDSVLGSVHDEVGRQIVHLSYKRRDVGPEAKKWRVQEIARALDSALVCFTQLAPTGRTCDQLRALASRPRVKTVSTEPTPATNATLSLPVSFVDVTWSSTKSS